MAMIARSTGVREIIRSVVIYRSFFGLAVAGVIAIEPFLYFGGRQGLGVAFQQREVTGVRDVFEHDGGFQRVARSFADGEGSMIREQHGGRLCRYV